MAIFTGASSFQSCESWRLGRLAGDAKASIEKKHSLSLLRITQCRKEKKNSSELRAIVCLPRNLLPLRSSRISMSEEGEFLKNAGFICFAFLLPYYYSVTMQLRTGVLVQNGTNKGDSTFNNFINWGKQPVLIAGESQVFKTRCTKQEKQDRNINRWSAHRCGSTVFFPLVCNSWWLLNHSDDSTHTNYCLNFGFQLT
jgi:hypothetical protein